GDQAAEREAPGDHVPPPAPEDHQNADAAQAPHEGEDQAAAAGQQEGQAAVLAAESGEGPDLSLFARERLHHVDAAQRLLRLVADLRELLLRAVAALVYRAA